MSEQSWVIVPAAGASRRFGAANKLLAPFRGLPVLAHVIRAARAAGPVIVVTGHDAGAVAAVARAEGAMTVHNPAHAGGMGGTLARGMQAVPPAAEGAFVLPGDMPLVPPGIFAALVAAGAGAGDLLRPTWGGAPGHPVWIGAAFRGQVEALTGDRGAAVVLAAHTTALRLLPCDDPGILADLDTPEALAAAAALSPPPHGGR